MNLPPTDFFHQEIKIASHVIGPQRPVFVIAEAGVAHFGSREAALQLVDAAVTATADAVKFQIFCTDELISNESPEWKTRLKPKELEFSDFRAIKDYCEKRSITFLATAHDERSSDFLRELEVPAIKVGSGEVGNVGFLRRLASHGKPLIVSTGMHTLEQIRRVLDVCREAQNRDVAVLHCITAYPTPPSDVNLACIPLLYRELMVPVGYSDHTVGWTIPLAAVALGACIIEKHLCLDKTRRDSQDCLVSCDPADLIQFVSEIRRVQASVGSAEKRPRPSEQNALVWARKSAVSILPLAKGTRIRPEHVRFKRPGSGISPEEVDRMWGRQLANDIAVDQVLRWTDFE
jgi:N-acetylneuraminate synthase/N,N'-diacetyllegionaminate synthase